MGGEGEAGTRLPALEPGGLGGQPALLAARMCRTLSLHLPRCTMGSFRAVLAQEGQSRQHRARHTRGPGFLPQSCKKNQQQQQKKLPLEMESQRQSQEDRRGDRPRKMSASQGLSFFMELLTPSCPWGRGPFSPAPQHLPGPSPGRRRIPRSPVKLEASLPGRGPRTVAQEGGLHAGGQQAASEAGERKGPEERTRRVPTRLAPRGPPGDSHLARLKCDKKGSEQPSRAGKSQ